MRTGTRRAASDAWSRAEADRAGGIAAGSSGRPPACSRGRVTFVVHSPIRQSRTDLRGTGPSCGAPVRRDECRASRLSGGWTARWGECRVMGREPLLGSGRDSGSRPFRLPAATNAGRPLVVEKRVSASHSRRHGRVEVAHDRQAQRVRGGAALRWSVDSFAGVVHGDQVSRFMATRCRASGGRRAPTRRALGAPTGARRGWCG
jgi:hypothetical protein